MHGRVPLLIAALVLSGAPIASAEAAPWDAIDAWIAARMDDARIPGAAVAIVKDGAIVHAKGYGYADAAGRPVTATTPFFVMSVTKPFTSLVILQLAEEGKLSLDDPVREHLPWFAVADERASSEIRIRHLLAHASGLPTVVPGEYDRLLAAARADDLEREVRGLRDVPLSFAPGERFQYSNAGYATLALVVETLEARPYADVLEARVFEPLGMQHAHARKAEAKADGLAAGHRSWFGFAQTYDWDASGISTGAGFTYASADDLARFAALHLSGGEWDGRRLASREGIHMLHTPVVEVPSPDGGRAYGLGWFVDAQHGVRRVHHAGVGPNYRADVFLFPDEGLGVVVLMNKNDGIHQGVYESIAPGVASLLLGHEPEVRAGGDLLGHARTGLVAIDAALLVAVALSVRRLRAKPGRRRALRAALGFGLAIGWAALALHVVPEATWPLRGMRLLVPDLAFVLITSAALGLALASLGIVHAKRGRWES